MVGLFKDWVLDPIALLFMLSLLIGLWFWQRARRKLAALNQLRCTDTAANMLATPRCIIMLLGAWTAVFLLCSAPVIVNPLVSTLESRYPSAQACPVGSHVVALGGGVDSRIRSADELERMSIATLARATAAARLVGDERDILLIAAGGALLTVAEADVMGAFWQALGIQKDQIILENQSSSTRENALNVAALLKPESISNPVRLVTSAIHMPRAMASFQQALQGTGIELCAVSVDVQALEDVPLYALMPQTTALVKFDRWLHELVATAIYKLNGWI